MLERIERVARIKGVEGRAFERKEGYNEEKKNKQAFKNALSKEMDKEVRPANEAGIGMANAYRLELSSRPTQSLFYREMVDLSNIEGKFDVSG
jgi:hypothetical protein